jgi:hypothetical protein
MRVLDVGGGLGGPARTLASEFGCAVEVLDLTEEFCRTGTTLTTRTSLGDLVSFRHGSALEIPYPRRRLRRGVDAAQLDEYSRRRAPLRRDTPRAAPRRTPGDARVPGRTLLPHPFPRAVGTQPGTQPPAPSRGGAHPHPRHEFRAANLDRRDRPRPAPATGSGSRRRPNDHRRSASTSCSATLSARCCATRRATSRNAGFPSSRPSSSASDRSFSRTIPNKTVLRDP